jgi:hypothetical protein
MRRLLQPNQLFTKYQRQFQQRLNNNNYFKPITNDDIDELKFDLYVIQFEIFCVLALNGFMLYYIDLIDKN